MNNSDGLQCKDEERIPNGVFQFAFSNFQNSSFAVLAANHLLVPVANCIVIETVSNIAPNLFPFTNTMSATNSRRFCTVRSP
jgi:hypothetical protein